MIKGAKIIGIGLATSGLIRASLVIDVVFGALIFGVAIYSIREQLIYYAILRFANVKKALSFNCISDGIFFYSSCANHFNMFIKKSY